MKLSNEAKVGALVLGTVILAGIFGWAIGVQNPFKRSIEFYVTYNFAGGIQVGSPVRVSGIKVGRVERIDFFIPKDDKSGTSPIALKEPGSAEDKTPPELIPVRLKVSVLKKAAVGIRRDSRFYINLAGIIGDRYIEITPGDPTLPEVEEGTVVAGVDPPRIDQLISQSFDLAGKITEVVEKNKGDITKSIETLYKLSVNLNKTLMWVDKSKIFKTDISKLINNLIEITRSFRLVSDKVDSPEGKKTLDLMYKLLWRLEPLDGEHVREFLQKEGVRVKMF